MLKRSDDMTQFQSTHPVRGATVPPMRFTSAE